MWEAGRGSCQSWRGERRRERRDKARSLSLSHTLTHSFTPWAAEWSSSWEEQNGKCFNTEGNTGRERHIGVVWGCYTNITHFFPPYTPTRKLAWIPAARLDGTARTPTSHTHTHAHTPTETHTLERTMVVQGAVTPGRTRRLMLKLPVGTLRRNSGERVRRERPSSHLLFHFLPSFVWLCLSLILPLFLCGRVLPCCCVCKWDLERFLANPGDSIRFELVEGKSRAKLLISPVDNTSLCFSSCQSESVNLSVARSVSVTANVFHCSPRFSRLQKSLTVGGLSSSAACLPVTFNAI